MAQESFHLRKRKNMIASYPTQSHATSSPQTRNPQATRSTRNCWDRISLHLRSSQKSSNSEIRTKKKKTVTQTSSIEKKKTRKEKNYQDNHIRSFQLHCLKMISTSIYWIGQIRDTSQSVFNHLSICGRAAPPK